MPEPQKRICGLADEAAAANHPEAALAALRGLREELVSFERSRVAEALRSGSSFGAVAKALGISRQAAHRRFRELAPTAAEPLALSSHARRAVHLAREEAARTDSGELASAHLLIGVLRSGGGTSSALESEGVTAEGARSSLPADDATRAAPGCEGHGEGRPLLWEAAEIARARRSRCIEAEHIALAALDAPDGRALRAITALGVRPAALRERLVRGAPG